LASASETIAVLVRCWPTDHNSKLGAGGETHLTIQHVETAVGTTKSDMEVVLMKNNNAMRNRKAGGECAAIVLGLLVALASAVPASAQLYTSGIFRATVPGVKTQIAQWVLDTQFFASGTGTIATMGAQGYTLTDLDINTLNGHRYYSAIFKSGVPSTQYWELTPAVFATKVTALANQNTYLISLHSYFSPQNGQLLYSGVFQHGTGPQRFSGELDWTEFNSYVETNAKNGYFLTSMASYAKAGTDYFIGAFRGGLKQGDSQYEFFDGDWDSVANQVLVDAANGLRLVTLANDRPGNYTGAWIAGTDPFEVVAATTVDVFSKKTLELEAAGLSPVRILIEGSYEPPIGLAKAFHDLLDGTPSGGYSYWVSEQGSTTAMGGSGYARGLYDSDPDTPMSQETRLQTSSVTKWIAGVALYKALEGHPSITVNTPIMNILGSGVLNGNRPGQGVNQVTILDLLNMDSGISELTCGAGNAPGYYDASAYLACALSNCTRPYPQTSSLACAPPGPAHICGPSNATGNCYHYSDPDYGILRDVIEHITGEAFESYVHNALFVPLGVNNSAYSATDIRNANCHPDLVTPTRPLYFGRTQTSGPGVDDQEYNGNQMIPPALSTARNVAVCGSGGMEMTVAQGALFWQGLMGGKLLNQNDLNSLLSLWMFNWTQSWTTNWSGLSYNKNGGYTIYNDQGAASFVVAVPDIDTQLGVFANLQGLLSAGVDFGGSESNATQRGLDWMGFHPVDTVSVVNQNSAHFGPMCFNVSGGGAAQGTAIIQWTCGPKPLPANELFTKVQSVSENGLFMLQVPQTIWTGTPMCITSNYDNQTPGDKMILYACNGGSNQWFKLGQPTSSGFSSIINQVSGQCLTVDDGSIYSGANIVQEPCVAGVESQQFSLESATAQ
jgi:CubicO group peptidase (beta-lactamase class C family)